MTDTPQARCAECGNLFAQADMVFLKLSWVCASCKPVFLQRLAEGAPIPAAGALWRHKKNLIALRDTPLPDVCVKCEKPAGGQRLGRNLRWHPRAYYLLILIGILIYIIVAIFVQKRAFIEIGLCEAHRKQRLQVILGSWLGFFAGLALLIFAQSYLALLGLLLMLVAPIFGLMQARIVYPSRIDENYIWLRGVRESFLNGLPEWPGKV